MPIRTWEIAIAAVFLVFCLAVGLVLGNQVAPQPAIGLVRFASEIDFNSAEQFISLLEAARQDDQIAGVVIELLSPGGYATSSESIYYAMLSLREQKPLVIVVDGLAASGGYYMAAAGNRIFAPASAYVGNIGTRGGRPEDPSIAVDELSSGPYKLEGGSRFDQIHQLDLVAQAFIKNVVSQRSASPVNPLKLTAEEVGEARIYLGSEALAVGLIDGEGSRSAGIQAAAELANLSSYRVVGLEEYLGMPAVPPPDPPTQASQSMMAQAPPGTIFMLDSRIPLPVPALPPALRALASKRHGDSVVPNGGTGRSWADTLLSPSTLRQPAGD